MIAERAVEEWKQADVIDWLVENGLVEFVQPFQTAGVDGERLLKMKDMEMEAMGISSESRKAMRRHLRKMPPTRSSIRRRSSRRSSMRGSGSDMFLSPTKEAPANHRDSWADLSVLAAAHPPTSPQVTPPPAGAPNPNSNKKGSPNTINVMCMDAYTNIN